MRYRRDCRYRRILLAASLLFLALLPAAAGAQEPAPDDLQQRFSEARRKFEARDFQGVISLLQPFQGDPSAPPPVLGLLGGTYVEMGRFQEAQAVLDPVAATDAAGPAILYHAARAALGLGQGEKAEGYLQRAVALAPQSPASRALGLRYGRQGKILEAYKLLRPWAEAHPDDLDARLAAAFAALELGRGSEAELFLSDLPQDNPQVRLLWGRLLLSRGDARGALGMLAPLEAAPPAEIERDLRWVLAEARLRIGDAASAVATLEGHTADDPGLALLLAQAHQQAGSPEKVLATLQPFVERLPDPAGSETARRALYGAIALEAGRALVAGARWPEAVALLAKATALDPANAPAWQVYGQALAGAGRRDEAQQALARFQEASRAAPGTDAAAPPTADATERAVAEAARLAASGQGTQALELIRRERQLAPDDPRARMMEVHLLLTLKRFEEAFQAAEANVALLPDNPDALYQRGAALLSLKRTAEAERDFRQALAVQPEHLAALNDLAVLLISQGKKEEARELLRKVLALRPDDPVAQANLRSLEG